jgi:hypothetical protein
MSRVIPAEPAGQGAANVDFQPKSGPFLAAEKTWFRKTSKPDRRCPCSSIPHGFSRIIGVLGSAARPRSCSMEKERIGVTFGDGFQAEPNRQEG